MNPFLSFPSTIKTAAATTGTVEKKDDDIGQRQVEEPIKGIKKLLPYICQRWNLSQTMSNEYTNLRCQVWECIATGVVSLLIVPFDLKLN